MNCNCQSKTLECSEFPVWITNEMLFSNILHILSIDIIMFNFKFSCHFPRKRVEKLFFAKENQFSCAKCLQFCRKFFSHTHYQHLIQDYEQLGLRSLNELCYNLLSKVDYM